MIRRLSASLVGASSLCPNIMAPRQGPRDLKAGRPEGDVSHGNYSSAVGLHTSRKQRRYTLTSIPGSDRLPARQRRRSGSAFSGPAYGRWTSGEI